MTHPDRLIFKYAGEVKNIIEKKYPSYTKFKNEYKINGNKKKNFFNWLSDENIEFSIEELDENWNYIENKIMAEIANKIWGKEFFYKQSLLKDVPIQDALTHFNQAIELYNKE